MHNESIRLTWVALAAAIVLGASDDVAAQGCGVGSKVAFADGRTGVGTITDIGTEYPYVGWFHVKFPWGYEWYTTEANGLVIEGTKTPCTAQKAAPPAAPRRSTGPALSGTGATPTVRSTAPAGAGCPIEAPPGRVSRSSSASEALFKRVIYEKLAVRAQPGSITAPKQIGVSFLSFAMDTPYRNTLTSPRFGDKRLHTGAPVGAMLYPLRTRERLCELYAQSVRRTVTDTVRTCFQNNDGDWVCPAGASGKVIETVLIPLE